MTESVFASVLNTDRLELDAKELEAKADALCAAEARACASGSGIRSAVILSLRMQAIATRSGDAYMASGLEQLRALIGQGK